MEGEQLRKELKRVLRYDRKTGYFHWKIHTNGRGGAIKPGDIAGTNKDGYVQIIYTDPDGIRHLWRAHRLAWWFIKGEIPKEIGHDNGKRNDNRWSNLESVTRRENTRNKNNVLLPSNKSGHRGVSWRADTGKWHARVVVDRRAILLGDYTNLDDAIAARKEGERRYFT